MARIVPNHSAFRKRNRLGYPLTCQRNQNDSAAIYRRREGEMKTRKGYATRNEEHPLDEKPNALGFPSSEQKSADLNLSAKRPSV
jgi:hypothetical protein